MPDFLLDVRDFFLDLKDSIVNKSFADDTGGVEFFAKCAAIFVSVIAILVSIGTITRSNALAAEAANYQSVQRRLEATLGEKEDVVMSESGAEALGRSDLMLQYKQLSNLNGYNSFSNLARMAGVDEDAVNAANWDYDNAIYNSIKDFAGDFGGFLIRTSENGTSVKLAAYDSEERKIKPSDETVSPVVVERTKRVYTATGYDERDTQNTYVMVSGSNIRNFNAIDKGSIMYSLLGYSNQGKIQAKYICTKIEPGTMEWMPGFGPDNNTSFNNEKTEEEAAAQSGSENNSNSNSNNGSSEQGSQNNSQTESQSGQTGESAGTAADGQQMASGETQTQTGSVQTTTTTTTTTTTASAATANSSQLQTGTGVITESAEPDVYVTSPDVGTVVVSSTQLVPGTVYTTSAGETIEVISSTERTTASAPATGTTYVQTTQPESSSQSETSTGNGSSNSSASGTSNNTGSNTGSTSGSSQTQGRTSGSEGHLSDEYAVFMSNGVNVRNNMDDDLVLYIVDQNNGAVTITYWTYANNIVTQDSENTEN